VKVAKDYKKVKLELFPKNDQMSEKDVEVATIR